MEAYSYFVGLTWRCPYGLKNSVDDTATVCGLVGPRFEHQWRKEILSFLYRPNQPCDLTGLLYNWYRGYFPWLCWPGWTMTSASSITGTIKLLSTHRAIPLLSFCVSTRRWPFYLHCLVQVNLCWWSRTCNVPEYRALSCRKSQS